MHKITNIEIERFLDQEKVIKIPVRKDATFIIGRNGTGKTTLVKLINACLAADRETLEVSKFVKVSFQFSKERSRVLSGLEVQKFFDDDGNQKIVYRFREKASSPWKELLLLPPKRQQIVVVDGHRRVVAARSDISEIRKRLSALMNRTWLSLQRGAEVFERSDWDPDDIEYTSGVDKKIEDVSNELTRYFSRLDRQVADLTQQFQRRWFLSFLATEKNPSSVLRKDINVEDEKNAIAQIFQKFSVPEESYATQLDRHVRLSEAALKGYKEGEGLPFRDFLVMYDVMKLHTLVEQWQELQEHQNRIYGPRQKLIDICNDLLFRKNLSIDASNLLTINTIKGDNIKLTDLSSGEKQLLIFLSETLLQEQKPYVFFADEPELSLHIDWQLKLVPSLLEINPRAQVIFATHSPDIVGGYQNSIVDMEELI